MSGQTIPVENVYYLLCYAWDRLEEAELTDVTVSPETKLPELFARVLRSGVAHLLKRGLDRTYVTIEDEIAGVRGRLDVAMSLKRAAFSRARAWCSFDELSPDTPANRIVKTTLRALAGVTGMGAELAESLRDLYRRLPGVSETRITGRSFRGIRLGRNTAYYGFLLDVCEIVYRNLLVDERSGHTIFRDFTRDDAQMAQLFERFLFRFFAREQRAFVVEAPQLRWRATGKPGALEYLPRMRTDIVLRGPKRTVVIDAKYYGSALGEYFGKATVRSEHLYQILAYMKHLEAAPASGEVSGILLYPRTTRSIGIEVMLFDHPFLAATIDLAQPWPGIHRDLLATVIRE